MTAKDQVKQTYPQAFMVFNGDTGTFKIYSDRSAHTGIALSASKPSEPEAWADALQAMQERAAAQRGTT